MRLRSFPGSPTNLFRVLGVLLLSSVLHLPFASSVVIPANFIPRLDGFIRCLLSDRSPIPLNLRPPELSIAVVANNATLHTAGYGTTGSGAPITADTLFSIGSLSKSFTSTAAAILDSRGLLKLSTPISQYSTLHTYSPYIDQEASLRDLFTHHTGISRNDNLVIFHSTGADWRDVMEHYVPLLPPYLPFRYGYLYNNFMVARAALVIEDAISVEWSDLVHQMLLSPLGMGNTTTSYHDSLLGHRATPYMEGPTITSPPIPLPPEVDAWVDLHEPAGAIHSSANDMSKWLLFHLGSHPYLLNSSNLDFLHSAEVTTANPSTPFAQRGYVTSLNQSLTVVEVGYGFNWAEAVCNGHVCATHDGALLGFISRIWIFPLDNFGWWIGTPSVTGTSLDSTFALIDYWIMAEMLGVVNKVDPLCKPQSSATENLSRWASAKDELEPLLAAMDGRRRQHSSIPLHFIPATTEAAHWPISPAKNGVQAAVDPTDLTGVYVNVGGPWGNISISLNGEKNATFPLLLQWEAARMLLSPRGAAYPNEFNSLTIAPPAIALVISSIASLILFDVNSEGAVRGLWSRLETQPIPYFSITSEAPISSSSSSYPSSID